MKPREILARNGLAAMAVLPAMAALPALVGSVWAQTQASPPATPLAPVPGQVPAGEGAGLVAFGVVVGLLLLTGVAVKLYDLKRKREDEAVALQARISEQMLMDPSLAALPITATVRMPFRRWLPAAVTLTGQAPSPELRDAAMRLVMRELSESRAKGVIEDHVTVDPLMFRRAA